MAQSNQLKLYNTLTRTKETFKPLDERNVRMYVCGPTVYDYAHIGNARPVIVFDVLFRLLRHVYGDKHVTYARNITDVDDKINARAVVDYPKLDPLKAIAELTAKTADQFHKDIAALGVLPPTVEPRATGHIEEMKALCDELVAKGHAYVGEGHVLFNVPSMADYGKLSGRSLEEMEAGARVEVAPYKKDPMDFVLWKPSKPGEPAWPSPCGIAQPGRPGWHIECSAMAGKHLGKVFDIHGGGIDLVFPHHENEVAQSRCAHGTPVMAQVWMHNGFLQVEGEKMSKSLGNFITIHELLQEWPGEVVRLSMLMTHYREPINWTIARLTEMRAELSDWISTFHEYASENCKNSMYVGAAPVPDPLVIDALCDDLNTALVVARIRELKKLAERGDRRAAEALGQTLAWLGVFRISFEPAYEVSGWSMSGPAGTVRMELARKYKAAVLRARAIVLNEYRFAVNDAAAREESRKDIEQRINNIDPRMAEDRVRLNLTEHCDVRLIALEQSAALDSRQIQRLVDARLDARRNRDFKEADRLRDELSALGVVLKDAKDKATGEVVTTWELAR